MYLAKFRDVTVFRFQLQFKVQWRENVDCLWICIWRKRGGTLKDKGFWLQIQSDESFKEGFQSLKRKSKRSEWKIKHETYYWLEFQWHQRCHLILVLILVELSPLMNFFTPFVQQMPDGQIPYCLYCFDYKLCYWQMEIWFSFVLVISCVTDRRKLYFMHTN